MLRFVLCVLLAGQLEAGQRREAAQPAAQYAEGALPVPVEAVYRLLLTLRTVDLATSLQSALGVARASAEAKGIKLELGIHGSLGPVHGDPVRLQQVVANRLNNPIRFTPRGGTSSVSLKARDRRAQITVSDTGVGLRAELILHLFDRFVQAEPAMTRVHGGLGLGLASVRHLVDVHGGEVRAGSPGEGHGATLRNPLK